MRLDNTNQGELAALMERVRKLEAAAPLGFSSITRGALRVASPEGLIVEGSARVSGTLSVTGTENVSGTLNVTGTLNADGTVTLDGTVSVTGPLTIAGATNITGPLTAKGATRLEGDTTQVGAHHVQGNQDITGTLAVKGVTTLEKELKVISGGKISVGSGMTLEPLGAGGGTVNFQPSGSVSASLGEILIIAPDLSASLSVGNAGVKITLPQVSATGKTPNVWADGSGKLWKLI